jgi:hypothetical protein
MKNILFTISILFSAIIINAQQPEGDWERISEMKSGYFRVIKNGMVGIINKENEVLIPCRFDQVYDLTDDNYVKVLKNKKLGLYHIENGIIIPAEYDQILSFEGNMVKVLKDRKYGYINKEGFIVIPVEYNNIWQPDASGLIKVLKDGKTGFYDKGGNVVIPADYQQIWSFEGELAKVLKNGKLGYVNKNGDEVIPVIYDHIGSFENGSVKALLSGVEYYFDENGNILEIKSQNEKVNVTIHPTPPTPITPMVTDTHPPHPIHHLPHDNSQNVDNNKDSYGREIIIHNSDNKKTKKQKNFKGHLASIKFGINGYLNSDFENIIPDENYNFMELNDERSYEISLYPFQQSTRLIGSYVGLVSAIGLQFNSYRFNLDSPDQLPEGQLWFPDTIKYANEIYKAKLVLFSLNVPLMLEFQLPDGKGNKGLYLSGGVIGSMKLNTHTKVVYDYDFIEYKRRLHNDIGIRMFRYSFMARAGYKWLGVYAQYSPVSLFKNGKGPELYPYSVGLSINF